VVEPLAAVTLSVIKCVQCQYLYHFNFSLSCNLPLQVIMKIKAYEFTPASVHASYDSETGGLTQDQGRWLPCPSTTVS